MTRPRLYHGDCLKILPALDENSIDTCITDPPYGLEFMGKDWDRGVPGVRFWEEVLRVLKPGATLLAFGGTRTFHRLACAIEDAGFEIRDTIMWVHGSGFPKGHDIGKAVGRAASNGGNLWDGWNVALKPAWEPIIVAMKPRDGTFANNALKWGVAGLWIDGARVPTNERIQINTWDDGMKPFGDGAGTPYTGRTSTAGRWPANLIHNGSKEVLASFPQTKAGKAIRHKGGGNTFGGEKPKPPMEDMGYSDSGSAARFFYCAKASRTEKDAGLESKNGHPTVKPLALMRYLCRLTKTPRGDVVLDPFMGSGTTGVAALEEGRSFIGIEIDNEYFGIAKQRIAHASVDSLIEEVCGGLLETA